MSAIIVRRESVHIWVPTPPMNRYASSNANETESHAVRNAASAVRSGPRMRMRRRPMRSSM